MRLAAIAVAMMCACGGNASEDEASGRKSKSRESDRDRIEAEAACARAVTRLEQRHSLEAERLSARVERLARRPESLEALLSGDVATARIAFLRLTAETSEPRFDIGALVDARGNIVAMHEVASVVARQWRSDDPAPGPTTIPALNAVLAAKSTVVDVRTTRPYGVVGAASVVDDKGTIVGAAVLIHALTSTTARQARGDIRAEVAYHTGPRVIASSFGRNNEDLGMVVPLAELLRSHTLDATPALVRLDGDEYFAAATAMPRLGSNLPVTSAALVLVRVGAQRAEAEEESKRRDSPYRAEVQAVFEELRVREEQYRVEHGEYRALATCPKAPSAMPKDVGPCLALWSKLGLRLPLSSVRCSYRGVSGRGTGAIVGEFEFRSPATHWYYVIANCDDEEFFTSSIDPTVQHRTR